MADTPILQSPTGNIYQPETPAEARELVSQGYTAPAAGDLAQFQKEQKYGTPEQMLQTGLEGATNAATLGTAPVIEKKIGEITGLGSASNEDRRARREINPGSYLTGEIAGLAGSGVGSGVQGIGRIGAEALLPEAAGAVAKASLENAIAGGIIGAGDETSKLLTDDPNQSVASALAHIGLSSALGLGFGAVSKLPSAAFDAMPEKAQGMAVGFVKRLGEHLGGPLEAEQEAIRQGIIKSPIPNFPPAPGTPLFEPSVAPLAGEPLGARLADKLVSDTLPEGLARSIGYGVGKLSGVPGAGVIGQWMGGRALTPIIKSVLPGLIRPIGRLLPSTDGMIGAIQYGLNVGAGRGLINDSVRAVFDSAKGAIPSIASEKLLGLDEKAKQLGDNPSTLLSISDRIAHYLPDHAAAAAKATMQAVNYLNSQRPASLKPAPLDTEQPPSQAQETAYKRTLGIAEQPLSILKRVKDGSITSKDLKDIQNLHPDMYTALQNRLQQEMITHLSDGKKIPYATKTGLALFTGQPLDTTMIPSSIQKIQATYGAQQQQQPQAPQGGKTKKGTKPLSKLPSQYSTPSQARQMEKQTSEG